MNQEWADQIGADGYGETAADAVLLARELLAELKEITPNSILKSI